MKFTLFYYITQSVDEFEIYIDYKNLEYFIIVQKLIEQQIR
jgi:hypothetical protein